MVVQDREASRRAVDYLTATRTSPASATSPGTPDTIIEAERFSGFLEGIAAAGVNRDNFVRWEGPFVFSTGVAAAEAFLRHERATDRDLRGLRRERHRFRQDRRGCRRVRVPQDVSVIGFDGIEFADYAEPTLTTFRQPMHELGRAGAQVLLRMLQGNMTPEDWQVRLPLTLLERDTTGPAPNSARNLGIEVCDAACP